MRANLVDLEASPSYLMLKDAEPGTETRRKFSDEIEAGKDLWTVVEAADAQLRTARVHADEKGSAAHQEAELRRLLTEKWFAISFADGRTVSMSVNQTLGEIRNRLAGVSEAVSAVEDLWTGLMPRIDSARDTLIRLEGEAQALGVTEPLIGRAKAKVEDLAERLLSDPLSVVSADGPQLDRDVAEAAKQMARLRTGHDNLDKDLNGTEERLASLRVIRARAEAAFVEASTKIDSVTGLVRTPSAAIIDGPDGLAAKLDGLFDDAGSTAWTQKRSLLDIWLTTVKKLEAQLIRAETANRAPLERRDELRGRLQAYKAKIAAAGKAEDMDFSEIVDRARSELFTSPTDLSVADAAIAELAARLRQ